MLTITPRAWQMLRIAARHKPNLEIAGFARSTVDVANGQIVIDDILIPPQDIGSAHAEFDVEDLDWLMGQVIDRGDHPKDWFTWWHSHTTMGMGPSSQDHETLFQLAGQSVNHFAVGLVIYSNETHPKAWMAYENPVLRGQFVEHDISVKIQDEVDPAIAEALAPMLEHVKEHVWAPQASKTAPTKFPLAEKTPREKEEDAAWEKFARGNYTLAGLTDREAEIVLEFMGQAPDSDDEYYEPVTTNAGKLGWQEGL